MAIATKAVEEERRGRAEQRRLEVLDEKTGVLLNKRSKSRGRESSRGSRGSGSRPATRASSRSGSASSRSSSRSSAHGDGITYRL